jgi:predicted PurR-regulated permease PerM
MTPPERASARPSIGLLLGAATTLLVVYFTLRALAGVPQALFLALFGVLVGLLLDAPTSVLARRLPRGLALALVSLAFVALIGGAVAVTIPLVSSQAAMLAHELPRGLAQAGELWSRFAPGQGSLWLAARNQVVSALPSVAARLVPFINGTISAVSSVLIVVVFALFVSVDPQAELNWCARLVPPRYEEAYWQLQSRLANTLRRWLLGTTVTMAIVAALTGVGLLIAGVSSWLALALITFITGFVPYLGSLVAGLLVLGAGLAVSPRSAVVAVIVFSIPQVLQGVLISPLVNRGAVRMPPALLLVWQLIMGGSFGVLGVLAAQPLLAAALVTIEYVYVERVLGRAPLG